MIEQDFINQCVDDVLAREGGFVDHAADRGGPTNFGITMRALASFRDAVVTRADIGALKRDEAAAIYEKAYARDTGFVDVSPQGDMTERWSVFALLFDSAVNCGPGTVTKWLQRACIELVPKETPIMVDGKLGPRTLALVAKLPASAIYRGLLRRRFVHYALIVESDPSQAVFIEGWTKRACEFLEPLRL